MTTSLPQAPHLDGEPTDAARPAAYRVLEAINSGDLSCLPECVTPGFVDHGSPVPAPPGPQGYAEVLGFVTSVLRICYAVEDLVQTPDRIMIRATASGTGVATVPPGPPAAASAY